MGKGLWAARFVVSEDGEAVVGCELVNRGEEIWDIDLGRKSGGMDVVW